MIRHAAPDEVRLFFRAAGQAPATGAGATGRGVRATGGRQPGCPPLIDQEAFHMNVVVNGKGMDLPDGLTVEGLLDHLKVRRPYTAVALNREITPRQRYGETVLSEGDRVEIVHPMGGG